MARHEPFADVPSRFSDVLGPALSAETAKAIGRAGTRAQAVVLALLSPDFLYR